MAAAIAGKNTLLTSLPEIGKRTAETIIAELSGKVDDFIEDVPQVVAGDDATTSPSTTPFPCSRHWVKVAAGAIPCSASIAVEPTITTPDALLSAVFRLREIR